MTNNEAIAYFRGVMLTAHHHSDAALAARLASVALRREGVCIDRGALGCPYCTPDAEGYVRRFGAFSIHNGFLEAGHCKPVKIEFCPECARPLNRSASE